MPAAYLLQIGYYARFHLELRGDALQQLHLRGIQARLQKRQEREQLHHLLALAVGEHQAAQPWRY